MPRRHETFQQFSFICYGHLAEYSRFRRRQDEEETEYIKYPETRWLNIENEYELTLYKRAFTQWPFIRENVKRIV